MWTNVRKRSTNVAFTQHVQIFLGHTSVTILTSVLWVVTAAIPMQPAATPMTVIAVSVMMGMLVMEKHVMMMTSVPAKKVIVTRTEYAPTPMAVSTVTASVGILEMGIIAQVNLLWKCLISKKYFIRTIYK